jgi:coiled-coil and C2 domain-containing protein 2A
MNPQLQIPKDNSYDYVLGNKDLGEEEDFLEKASLWLKDYMSKKENEVKNIVFWGEVVDGPSIFLPRFLANLQPPKTFDLNEDCYEKCARYVSLIPYRTDSIVYDSLPDMWTTCQEFLDLRAGGHEEHAILLCNYFNWID